MDLCNYNAVVFFSTKSIGKVGRGNQSSEELPKLLASSTATKSVAVRDERSTWKVRYNLNTWKTLISSSCFQVYHLRVPRFTSLSRRLAT